MEGVLLEETRNLDFTDLKTTSDFPSGRDDQSAKTDDFPHLDIVNDFLDDENGISKATGAYNKLPPEFQ